jgi:steroid 5-alpha reductase family enzyme
MIDWHACLLSLLAIAALALIFWLASLVKRDVSVVDSAWSLLFLGALASYIALSDRLGERALVISLLTGTWALRLSLYITWRNWGRPEDRRYQAIRRNHEPGFAVKSLYMVFGLQGVLAWLISAPLMAGVSGTSAIGVLDYIGILLWGIGMTFEVVGDQQLARFKADPQNRNQVMEHGLWRYTRHPNYFGECCIWWGFYLIALAAGGWWTLWSPVLMTFLLLRVSGVTLLENDLRERRPQYRQYMVRTNAFIPGPPRASIDTMPR